MKAKRMATGVVLLALVAAGCASDTAVPDAAHVFVINRDGSGRRQLTQDERWHGSPIWSPDGRRLAWLSSAPTAQGPRDPAVEFAAADGSGHRRVALLSGRSSEFGPLTAALDWSPDGRTLAAVHGKTLLLIAGDGSSVRRISLGAATSNRPLDGAFSLSWSPMGRRFAIVESRSRLVGARTVVSSAVVIRRRDGALERRLPAPGQTQTVAWSPDGKLLAFSSAVMRPGALIPERPRDATPEPPGAPPQPPQAQQDIFIANAGTGDVERITQTPAQEKIAGWEPNGRQLLFTRNSLERSSLWVTQSRGGERKLTDDLAAIGPASASWSPDGRAILLGAVVGQGTERRYRLYLLPADGGRLRRLSGEVATASESWSPDGKLIVFTTYGREVTHATDRIELVRSDGGGRRMLAELKGNDIRDLTWSPNGRALAFTAQRARRPD